MSLGKKDIKKNIKSKAQISSHTSDLFLNHFLDILKGQKFKRVKISNFGTFYLRITPSRLGRNPRTGKNFPIPSRHRLSFKASQKIKNFLN